MTDPTDFSGYKTQKHLEDGHAMAMALVRSMLGDDELCTAIQDAVAAGITFAMGYGIALGHGTEVSP